MRHMGGAVQAGAGCVCPCSVQGHARVTSGVVSARYGVGDRAGSTGTRKRCGRAHVLIWVVRAGLRAPEAGMVRVQVADGRVACRGQRERVTVSADVGRRLSHERGLFSMPLAGVF